MTSEKVEVGEVTVLEGEKVYEVHIAGNPMEIARALLDFKTKHGFTYSVLSEYVPYSPGTITKYLSLLTLEPELQAKLAAKEMTYTAGYNLARLPKNVRAAYLKEEGRITIKAVEKTARAHSLSSMYGIFSDIETITAGIEQVHTCDCSAKLEAIKTWLKDAPGPLFLVPGQSPFISETQMEVWLEKCPIEILEGRQ